MMRFEWDHRKQQAIAADPADPANDPAFWQHAELVYPVAKQRVRLRLERDVLAFFKAGGRGYQTRIQAVLRSCVEAQRRA